MMIVTSPLEQFQILPVIPFSIGSFDFSITNSTVIISIGLFSFCFILNALVSDKGSYNLVPNRWQTVIEGMYELIAGLLKDTLGDKGQAYFPYVFTLFSFILVANLIGLVPYSFTVTSHLIVTFSLAIMTFIGLNIICVREHGHHIFSLFLPAGSIFPTSGFSFGSYRNRFLPCKTNKFISSTFREYDGWSCIIKSNRWIRLGNDAFWWRNVYSTLCAFSRSSTCYGA